MTEPTIPATDPAVTDPNTPADPPAVYTPPATQADLDRIITDRVNRTKAQFKDYAELKKQADELAQIRAANQTEAQKQAEELARWQSDAEKWRGAAVGNRIEALASVDFADPSDATGALGTDLTRFLDSGGQINEDAIKAELADVLDRKPHWRRPADQPAGPRLPAPNPAQGTGANPAPQGPAQEFAALVQRQLR